MRILRAPAVVAALTVALIAPAGCAKSQPGDQPAPGPSTPVVTTPATEAPPTSLQSGTPATTGAPGTVVISSRVAYQWHWPNDGPASMQHTYPVPPVPALTRIGAGDHPRDPGDPPFNRMSFTFTTAMPSYSLRFVDGLVGDANGQPIPLLGRGVLKVTFRQAQAHTADGARSTIAAKPSPHLGMGRMVDYAQAGDYEGMLIYGIGITWPNAQSNPQIAVRAYEVVRADANGYRQYVVAIDVAATQAR
jgi:hypothetical protein